MKIFFAICLLIFLYSCSPVRTRYPIITAKNDNKIEKINDSIRNSNKEEPIPLQKKDILLGNENNEVKEIKELENKYYAHLSEIFEEAVEKFDRKDFKNSCNDFKLLMNTLDKDDSLQLEASFFYAECLIELNDFYVAEILLNDIRNTRNIPTSIEEKVLVRLGQLYCILNAIERAYQMFNEFNSRYPDSIYKPLAKCN